MKTVKIFGYSDDNVEIRGDLGDDEFGAYGNNGTCLHFDDGTVIRGVYDHPDFPQRGWRIEVVTIGEGAIAAYDSPMMEDGDHFSDVLVVTGNFTSVAAWRSPDGPDERELTEAIEEKMDDGQCTIDQLRNAYAALLRRV